MLVLIFCFCIVSSCTLVKGHPFRNHKMLPVFPGGRIVGGSATDITAVPYQLQLENDGFQFCGASIISGQFVLTAAHCTDGRRADSLQVRYGSSCHATGGSILQVAAIFQHHLYSPRTSDYDVAVLRLRTAIPLSDKARPVLLASSEPMAGSSGIVSGWGVQNEVLPNQPKQLQSTIIPVVDRSECNTAYEDLITTKMICAGVSGQDSCMGDSGGAFVVGGVQVGVVSWGYGCARPGFPGVYTNVAQLRSFIDKYSEGLARWV